MLAPSNIQIRPAVPADADTLAAFNLAMAEETEGRALDRATAHAGVRRVLSDPGLGVYYVAEVSGSCVGQLLITFEWSDWRNGLFWWIQSVYVAPDAREQGVYAALHRYVERLARHTPGVCGLRLYVDRCNEVARRVYERLGLRATSYDLLEIDWVPRIGADRPEDAASAEPDEVDGSGDVADAFALPNPALLRDRPIARDLYCLRCGYNLRGLSGDPVRCPECGYHNPLRDAEIPADLISQQLRKMESAPAYAVGTVLVVGLCVGTALALDALPCLLPCIVAAVAWPLLIARFRASCLGKPGWVGAIVNYHFCGLVMISTTIGGAPPLLWATGELLRRLGWDGSALRPVALAVGVIALIAAVPLWVRWLYRRAKQPMEALQREVAVTLARQTTRRRLTRAPRRGLFG